MVEQRTTHVSVELMELLNKIHDKVNEVGERIARIEAQDHADVFRSIRRELEIERDHRIKLQVELANLKTRFAPIVASIAMIGAACIDYFLSAFKH